MTREEASEILDDYDVNFDGHTAEEIAEAFDMAFKALEPREGHWIEKYHEIFKYYCDKCGTGSDLRTNFCPNCGARMESENSDG